MLTNLRINADVGVSFKWFIFNLQRRQIYTVLYNNIQCRLFNMWHFKMQKPLTGDRGLQCKGANFSPLQAHAENQLPRFPLTIGLTPSPSPPFQTNIPTHVMQFKLAEDDISTLRVLLILYMQYNG
jgi:hypothetical protein